MIAHRRQRRRHFPSQGGAIAEAGFDLQETEPKELEGVDPQTPQIRSKGAFNKHLDTIRRDLAEPGWLALSQVGAHRDLGGGTGSMVQADQIKNGQPTSFPDVLQGLVGERDRDSGRLSVFVLRFSDRLAEPEALDVKPRRHDDPTPCRFPFPVPP